MLIEIDFNSDEALYLQLRNQIIMGIATMELREGDSLPSGQTKRCRDCCGFGKDKGDRGLEAGPFSSFGQEQLQGDFTTGSTCTD